MSIDLKIFYGGLALHSPVVVGACPLTAQESIRLAMESAGAGAVVLPSLFQEHVIRWNQQKSGSLSAKQAKVLESASRGKEDVLYENADSYLSMVNRASVQLSIPVIASLNGHSASQWSDFAGELQEAGAAAIELNLHHPPPHEDASPREIEDSVVDAVRKIDAEVQIPIFVKLDRQYTSLPHLARRLQSGIQGIVLFGRSPDIDIELDDLRLKSCWGLTQPGSIVPSLRAIMRVHAFCPALAIAACGGIGSTRDVVKALLAGADVAMVTSAVYREGTDVIRVLIDGLVVFMERHQMRSIRDLQLNRPLEFASDEDRAQYVRALTARLDADATHVGERTMHGDRWGHPFTET